MNYAQGAIIGSVKGAHQGVAQSSPRAVNPSAFGTIEAALADVQRIATRLQNVVDRLAGSTPLTGVLKQATGDQPSNGLLNDAIATARQISVEVDSMNADLARLEECLP